MNKPNNSIQNTMLTYGLILGGVSIIFNLMLFFLDMHTQQSPAVGIVSVVIMIGVLMFAFIQFKKANEGFLSLGEALKLGLGISLVAAILGVIYSFVLTEVMDPGMMQKVLDMQMETIRANNPEMSQEAMDATRSMSEKFSTPLIRSAIQLIIALFIGFIISLIGGLILKKSRPE
ncbi:MAG: DUF4199 domain-containing protein [Flavobacteriaceae bacterium]